MPIGQGDDLSTELEGSMRAIEISKEKKLV